MVSIETRDTDPAAAALPSKKRGGSKLKAKQQAMNGNHSDYHEGHDHMGMGRPTTQLTDEELFAKRASKEVEAAKLHEVRNAAYGRASLCQHAVLKDSSQLLRPSTRIGEVQKSTYRHLESFCHHEGLLLLY